mgnify:CR=1 FL=1
MTGDKIETAMNIGVSAGLLDSEMDKYIVDETDEFPLRSKLEEIAKNI